MRASTIGSALVVLALLAAGCSRTPEAAADLVFRGGAVYTVDPVSPWAEAVAVRDGRIVRVGGDEEVSALIGADTEVVELEGGLLLPGFHDTHVHPVSGGIELGECDLNPAESVEDIERLIGQCLARDPDAPWLRGGGFQLSLFTDGAPPRGLLDRLVPDRPAFFTSLDAHSAWVNSRALALAGITRRTADPPPDGVIVRDANGNPQGTLRESAMELVSRLLPPHTDDQIRAGLERALAMAASFGITTLHEANADARALAAYRAADDAGVLTARTFVALEVDPEAGIGQVADLATLADRYRSRLVRPVEAKIYADGVIEGGTAALIEPYLDRPGFRGELRWPPDALAAIVAAFDQAGFKVHVHAIGDRAIQATLDAFEALPRRQGAARPRHVMAHIQLFDPPDVARTARLGVVASFQPLWAYADTYITELTQPRLGPERSGRLYPIRSLVDAGAIVAAGSDWSVTSMDPLQAIEVGITRRSPDAEEGPAWIPDERVDLATMLRIYTLGGAMAGEIEDETGSITVGKAADLVLVDRNLFEMAPTGISDARVRMTVFEGRVVYRAEPGR